MIASASTAAGPSSLPVLDGAAVTHTGAVRTLNEDSFLVGPWLCLIADGMGGHDGGDVASRTIVDQFEAVAENGPLELGALEPLIADINTVVHESSQHRGPAGMGSTLVGVAVVDNGGSPSAVIFNVGDSRCYQLRGEEFRQVTTDHSHVQELIDAGRLSPSEALTHPLRNVVTRAIGPEPSVVADFEVLRDQKCRLLLCSDGVSGELDEQILRDILASDGTPQATALALIEAVLRGPARDNATAVVVDLDLTDSDDITIPKARLEALNAEITAPRSTTTKLTERSTAAHEVPGTVP
jgi:protein phosphatase